MTGPFNLTKIRSLRRSYRRHSRCRAAERNVLIGRPRPVKTLRAHITPGRLYCTRMKRATGKKTKSQNKIK